MATLFTFHGFHARGQYFKPPVIASGDLPTVFGRVSQGGPPLPTVRFGNSLNAPHRNGIFIFEVFSSVRDEEIWNAVFDNTVAILVSSPPVNLAIDAQLFQGPIDSDIPGDIFPSCFGFVGTVPYRSRG